MGNKDRNFWKGLKEWDVMVLMETWIEERMEKNVRKKFRQKLGRIEIGNFSLEEQWREIERRIKQALEKVESKWEGGNRRKVGWWDGECKEAKREIRKKLREWKKKGEGEDKIR